MSEDLKPILIAGAGLTGLKAALELSRLAVPLRIIDKQAAPRNDFPCHRGAGAHAGVARAASAPLDHRCRPRTISTNPC